MGSITGNTSSPTGCLFPPSPWASGESASNLSLLGSLQSSGQYFVGDLRKIQPCFLFCVTSIWPTEIMESLTHHEQEYNLFVSAPSQAAPVFYLLNSSDMVSNKTQAHTSSFPVVSLKHFHQFKVKTRKVGRYSTVISRGVFLLMFSFLWPIQLQPYQSPNLREG